MIRELAQVTAVHKGWVEVSTQLKTGCNGCQHQNHCGAGLLSKALPNRNGVIQLQVNQDFQVGEQVELLMPESAMVRFSMALYGIPMLALIISALLGQWLWPTQEFAVIGFTFVSTAASLYGLKRFLQGRDAQIRRTLQVQTLASSDTDCRKV